MRPKGDPVAYGNKELPKEYSPSKTYYDGEICGGLHPVEWDGDCRQDNARFDPAELDRHHGAADQWTEVPMSFVTGVPTE